MKPVLADATLKHAVIDGIFLVWVRSFAGTVEAREVVIVLVIIVHYASLVKELAGKVG